MIPSTSKAISRNPLIIGIAITTYYYHPEIIEFYKYLHQSVSGFDTYIVVGGHSASFFADFILNNDDNMDFVITGQGEEPKKQLFNCFYEDDTSKLAKVSSLIYRANSLILKNDAYNEIQLSSLPMGAYSEPVEEGGKGLCLSVDFFKAVIFLYMNNECPVAGDGEMGNNMKNGTYIDYREQVSKYLFKSSFFMVPPEALRFIYCFSKVL